MVSGVFPKGEIEAMPVMDIILDKIFLISYYTRISKQSTNCVKKRKPKRLSECLLYNSIPFMY